MLFNALELVDIYDAVDVVNYVGTSFFFFFFVQQEIKESFCAVQNKNLHVLYHGIRLSKLLFLNLCKFFDVADNTSKAEEYICSVIYSVSLLDMSG